MEATVQNGQFDLGHWVLRLIAWIIDVVVVAIVAAILFLLLSITVAVAGLFALAGWLFLFPFILGVLMVLYTFVLDVSWGGTLGKRVLGLRVQTVNGGRITYNQSFVRNISKIYWLLVLLDWLIGIATPGDRRQKYTDRIAGVTVVQVSQAFTAVSPPPSQPPPPPPSQ